jgi:hypothetical protein
MLTCRRGKAQEDPGSNPVWANTFKNPISKIHKKWMAESLKW